MFPYKLKAISYKFVSQLLNTIFPIRCIGCATYDTWLCTDCIEKIPLVKKQVCPQCKEEITSHGQLCQICKKSDSSLDGILIASRYRGTLLKKAVHYLKYRFVEDLREPLGTLLRKTIENHPSLPTPDLLIPVPIHKKRLRWRGFNQAESLAYVIRPRVPIETTFLARTKHTKPQMTFKHREDRMHNLDGSLIITDRDAIKNKTVLLIDDITTTGTTLLICANALKDAGATAVYALVLARE